MKQIVTLTVLLLFMLPTVSSLNADGAPTSKEVVDELHKLLKQDKSQPRQIKFRKPETPDDPISINPLIAYVIKNIFLLILIIAGIIVLIYIITQIVTFSRNKTKPITTNEDSPQHNIIEELDITNTFKHYKSAIKLAEHGNYNMAIIQLHKGTIAYLLDNIFIQPNIKYTNRDLKTVVKSDNTIYNALSIIIYYAEYAAFSTTIFCKKDFSLVLKNFEGVFI